MNTIKKGFWWMFTTLKVLKSVYTATFLNGFCTPLLCSNASDLSLAITTMLLAQLIAL